MDTVYNCSLWRHKTAPLIFKPSLQKVPFQKPGALTHHSWKLVRPRLSKKSARRTTTDLILCDFGTLLVTVLRRIKFFMACFCDCAGFFRASPACSPVHGQSGLRSTGWARRVECLHGHFST